MMAKLEINPEIGTQIGILKGAFWFGFFNFTRTRDRLIKENTLNKRKLVIFASSSI